MEVEYQKEMLRNIGKFVRDEIQKAIEPLKARIAELEARGVEYRGVWQRSCEYRRGSLTTHDGNLWACIADAEPNEWPGQSSKWQLAAKAPEPRRPTQNGARPQPVERRT